MTQRHHRLLLLALSKVQTNKNYKRYPKSKHEDKFKENFE